MDNFRMRPLDRPQNNIIALFKDRRAIDLDPAYQRIGGIWPSEMRALFIDSLVNGVDIPKIYLHLLTPPRKRDDGTLVKYAVVDGKQRLQTIWDFIEGGFNLASDFVFFDQPDVELKSLTYSQLGAKAPVARAKFDQTVLPIILVETHDEQVIDNLFDRLNQAANLNAPEHRNALGGPLRRVIRELSGHAFFKVSVPFDNGRYKYYDLAAKFLWIADQNSFTSTKRKVLDEFVIKFRENRKVGLVDASEGAVRALKAKVTKRLDTLHRFFPSSDALLSSVTMLHLFFHMSRLHRGSTFPIWDRKWFESLANEVRLTNKNRRLLADDPNADVDLDLEVLRFVRNQQSLNDGNAMRDSYRIMAAWIGSKFGGTIPSTG